MTSGFSSFFELHFVYIYFFYGLAFFSMGLALLVESHRESRLMLAQSVHLLGYFGLVHGSHEFVEMFILASWVEHNIWIDIFRIVMLIFSYVPLVAAGIAMLPNMDEKPRIVGRITILVVCAYVVQVYLIRLIYKPTFHEWLHTFDTIARYSLAIPGATLVGVGLFRYRHVLKNTGMSRFGYDLAVAGVAIFLYGVIGQSFPPASVIFPSMYINSQLFLQLFGYPVQLFRGVMAVVAAIAIIRGLRAFEEETRIRLKTAGETERGLQVAARELSLLYETSSLLTSTYELETLTQKAVDRITRLIEPISCSAIYVPEGIQGHGAYVSTCGADVETSENLKNLLADYIEQSRIIPDIDAFWVNKDGQEVSNEINAFLHGLTAPLPLAIRRVVLPLRTHEYVVGSLLLQTNLEGPFLSSLEAPTIVALARQMAVAIENARLVLALRQRENLQKKLFQRATHAQEAERKRIARELHDDTGQALTALALGLQGVAKLIAKKPDLAKTQIDQLQHISTRALEDLRHQISDLRPSHLDDLGLVAALRWYVEQVNQRSHTRIEFVSSGTQKRLFPETETTLFRIAQEGLGNILKHAVAKTATLTLYYGQDAIQLTIEDDGLGFDTADIFAPGAGRAWGLIGMQERASLAGGELEIDSSPGGGTRIVVLIPWG